MDERLTQRFTRFGKQLALFELLVGTVEDGVGQRLQFLQGGVLGEVADEQDVLLAERLREGLTVARSFRLSGGGRLLQRINARVHLLEGSLV